MFDYQKKVTTWEDSGTEPPEGLRKWQVGEKPPAAWWNWFWDAVQKCFDDIKNWIHGHQNANTEVHGVGTGHIETTEGAQTKVNNVISAHLTATDPHPQYLSDADFAAFNGTPVGCIQFIPYATIPNGWLECNGQAISRTNFSELFTKIGTTFGTGDGVTTFNIPDLRGEFIRGWDHGRGIDNGRALGSRQISTQVIVDDDQQHTVGAIDWTNNNLPNLGYESYDSVAPSTVGLHFVSSTMANTNSSTYFLRSIRPRNVALIAIIKAYGYPR